MVGPVLLLAALASPAAPVAEQGAGQVGYSQPGTRATANARVSIRIISGVRFGADHLSGAEGATRRKAEITQADGLVIPAELLEFQ